MYNSVKPYFTGEELEDKGDFFFLFRATPAAYGGSQARDPIGATAYSNARIQATSATYSTAHSNAGSLTH